MRFGELAVDEQSLEIVTRTLTTRLKDGLFGLASGSTNQVYPDKQHTWFENVQSQLAQPVFTVDLRADGPGNYTFGRIDSNYEGNITYTDQVDLICDRCGMGPTGWFIESSGYAVGDAPLSNIKFTAAIDTGTTAILLPSQMCEDYYASIGGILIPEIGGSWYIPKNVSAPDFTFAIRGGYRVRVPGEVSYTVLSTVCLASYQQR